MVLESPLRLVFDFNNSKLVNNAITYKSENPDIKSVRSGQYQENISRVVVDLEKNVSYNVSVSENDCVITFEKTENETENTTENKEQHTNKKRNQTNHKSYKGEKK